MQESRNRRVNRNSSHHLQKWGISCSRRVKTDKDSFVNLLVLDITVYAEKYGTKAVRRNITSPAWLDTFAQKNNLSLSKIVQDSLLDLAKKS